MRNKRGGQPLTSVSGQQSGAAPRRRRVNFSLPSSGLIPQWAKLRCGSPSCSFSCRCFLSVYRWRIYAAGRQPPGRSEGSEPAVVRWLKRQERRVGEERSGARSHSDQLPMSLQRFPLMSTVNAAMQRPGGATAAVQLLQCSSCSTVSKHKYQPNADIFCKDRKYFSSKVQYSMLKSCSVACTGGQNI